MTQYVYTMRQTSQKFPADFTKICVLKTIDFFQDN